MTVKDLKKLLSTYEDNTKVVIKCGNKFVDFYQGGSESLNNDLEVDTMKGNCSIVLEPRIIKE